VEWIATYLFFLVAGGVYYPISSASLGVAIFFVRIWYALGYTSQGPKGRVIPFIINIVLTVILSIFAVLSGIQHIIR
jgi:glutathione S-transferase